MNQSLPKALVKIGATPNIVNTIDKAYAFYDRIHVVYNKSIESEWNEIFRLYQNVFRVKFFGIRSGKGDAHAVLAGLRCFPSMYEDEVTIIWGDAFIKTSDTFAEIEDFDMNGASSIIPVVFENDPYVQIVTDSEGTVKDVIFSKYGHKTSPGYHDQSIFKFKQKWLFNSLEWLCNRYWDEEKQTYLRNGFELSLLHSFKLLDEWDRSAKAFPITNKVLGFNTQEELENVKKEAGY